MSSLRSAPSTRSMPALSIIRPVVLIGLLYFGLCSIWFLWILLNLRLPEAGDPEPFRLITIGQYVAVSVADAILLVTFVVDGWLARGNPPALRRAHLAGLGLGAIVLGLIQLGCYYAYGPIPVPQ